MENLSRVLLDPAVNILFEQMRRMIKEKDEKIEKLTAEMEAVQYSTSTLLGRRLLTKCTSLITENEELGNLVGALCQQPSFCFALLAASEYIFF